MYISNPLDTRKRSEVLKAKDRILLFSGPAIAVNTMSKQYHPGSDGLIIEIELELQALPPANLKRDVAGWRHARPAEYLKRKWPKWIACVRSEMIKGAKCRIKELCAPPLNPCTRKFDDRMKNIKSKDQIDHNRWSITKEWSTHTENVDDQIKCMRLKTQKKP